MSNFYTEPFVSAGEMEFPSRPYITAQPQNHTATGPETYELRVIAAGAVSYQWEVFDGESWSTIPGATSDNLTITIDPSMNGWRYRVIVTGADGSTVTSKAAQIAVKGVYEYTLEGAIVTFNGPARITSLTADINAVQSGSGDPSPTNVRPISGWDAVNVFARGVNLWDEQVENGTYNWTTGAKESATTSFRCVNYVPVKPSTTYICVAPTKSATYIRRLYLDADYNFISATFWLNGSTIFTTPSNCYYIGFAIAKSAYGNSYNSDISVNYPSTNTEYHAYNGTTYPISLPQTVYGGVLDVINGELMTDHPCADGGDLNWIRTTTAQADKYRFYANLTGLDSDGTGKCSIYKQIASTFSAAERGFAFYQGAVYVYDPDYETASAADFKTHMTGVQILYPLSTPQITTISPTAVTAQSGVNNLFADSGNVEIVYVA